MRRLLILTATLSLLGACATEPATPPPASTTTSPSKDAPMADFGHYGPYRLGMTADDVRAAGHGTLSESVVGGLENCKLFVPADATAGPENQLGILLPQTGGYRVAGIRLPNYARTDKAIGYGSTVADTKAAYQGREITESQSQVGTEILVKGDGPDSYLGFTIGEKGNFISEVRLGTHDYAANYELCSG